MQFPRSEAAIAGIGCTEFSKDSGVSVFDLAARAVKAAVQDAGLQVHDIDGLATFGTNDSIAPNFLAPALGVKNLNFYLDQFLGWQRLHVDRRPGGARRERRGGRLRRLLPSAERALRAAPERRRGLHASARRGTCSSRRRRDTSFRPRRLRWPLGRTCCGTGPRSEDLGRDGLAQPAPMRSTTSGR